MSREPDIPGGSLVVLTGPSGVGKSSITRRVLQRTGIDFSVSATTRRPRPGETDGVDYRFVDRPTFRKMIDDGELLEYAEVFGEWYGTPKDEVRRAVRRGRKILLDIDVQGGLQVHRQVPDATFILVLPPSEEELKRRLAGRGTEDPRAAERRFAKAREEIAAARRSGAYTYTVVNDDLESAVRQVVEIIHPEKRQT